MCVTFIDLGRGFSGGFHKKMGFPLRAAAKADFAIVLAMHISSVKNVTEIEQKTFYMKRIEANPTSVHKNSVFPVVTL